MTLIKINTMAKEKLDWFEAQEIADYLLKINNPDSENDVTENALAEKWNIDFDTFHEIVEGIFDMIDFSVSPITNTAMVGISKGNCWLAKKERDQQFIAGIIQWATEGEKIPEDKNGFIKTITYDGKPEYDFEIRRPKNNK